MSKLFSSLILGGAVALSAASAQAFPIAPSSGLTSSDVIQIAGGCGPGWHRGPGGGCRPNRGPVVVVPAPVVVAPRPVVVVPGPRCFWRGSPAGPVRVCR